MSYGNVVPKGCLIIIALFAIIGFLSILKFIFL